ncbi:MAG: YfhO family protein [Raineya sp.]
MNLKELLPKILPHFVAVLVFVIISFAYMSPVMRGQALKQHDVIQHIGASHQSIQEKKQTGEHPFWNPYMFSGMPNYMIFMDYPASISVHIGRVLVYSLPEPANLLFLYMLGAYVGLCLMGFNPWISALGAISYAFTSYNIINIGAGHISKCISVATAPMVLGAILLVYKGKFWVGGILLAFLSAVHQYANFIQMSYYLFLSIIPLAIAQFVVALRQKQVKNFFFASLICLGAGVLSISNHTSRYLVINEYTKETTRGKSELADTSKKSGLDKEYAFNWSYGIGETLNFFIADAFGGSSFEMPKESSKIMEALSEEGDKMNIQFERLVNILYSQGLMPSMYWGEQPGTGGPAYMGIVLLFLFACGMLISKNPLKWWLLASVFLYISIAWGKNFPLNDLFFDYLPLFNKFRAVTMILSLMPLFLIIGAAMGLQEFLEMPQEQQEQVQKKLKWTAITFGGIMLILALLGSSFLDFRSSQDKAIEQAISQQSPELAKVIIKAVKKDREALFTADSWRSLIFVLLAIGVGFALIKKYIRAEVAILSFSLLALIDLWGVDKRYLNNEKFVDKEEAQSIEANSADEQILKDKDYYRVLNLANPFNDATPSYFHYSAGGYHGAKLGRYQDLITAHISKETEAIYKELQENNGTLKPNSDYKPILDMLNVRYFIVPLKGGQSLAVRNPDAVGAACFVENYKIVKTANEELETIAKINPRKTMILREQKSSEKLSEVKFDSLATIKLTKYSSDEMLYESNAVSPQLALFSEIYYKTPTSGWQAYIDGQAVEHLKVNYALRGLIVPAGKHKIAFRFEPHIYRIGETLTLVSSVLMLLLLVGVVLLVLKKKVL